MINLIIQGTLKWVKKSELKCFVSYTCLRTYATNSWYFDSGCSRHMTGNKDIVENYEHLSEGLVTFGDDITARVLGRKLKINSDDTKLWHERLGHLNYKSLKRLSNAGAVHGLPKIGKQLA